MKTKKEKDLEEGGNDSLSTSSGMYVLAAGCLHVPFTLASMFHMIVPQNGFSLHSLLKLLATSWDL